MRIPDDKSHFHRIITCNKNFISILFLKKIYFKLNYSYWYIYNNILAAKQALKRKKRYEKELQHLDGTLSTLEMQRETLQNAKINTAVLTTMKNAADVMKAAHKSK